MNTKHSAAVVIRNKKVLLIKRSKEEDSEPGKWCLPNETLKKNETPEKAVVRGVKEELGMNFSISKKLFDHFCDGHMTFVFLGIASGEVMPNSEEVSEYGWFSLKDVTSLEFAYGYDKVIGNLYGMNFIV